MTEEELIERLKEEGLTDAQAEVAANRAEANGVLDEVDDVLIEKLKSRLSIWGPEFTGVRLFGEANVAIDEWRSSTSKANRKQDALSEEDQKEVERSLGRELSEEETDLASRSATLSALTEILGRQATEADLARARSALSALYGPGYSVTDSTLLQRIESKDPRIIDALETEEVISANEMMGFTDNRTGQTVYVSKGVYDGVLKGIAGAADYQLVTNAAFADSARRGFANENIYALLAHSHGLLDKNQTFGNLYKDTPVGRQPGVDEGIIRKQFARTKLIQQGRIPQNVPKRYLSVKLPFGGKRIENPLWKVWMNPEDALSAEEWQQMRPEYDQYLFDRRDDERRQGRTMDDALRVMLYNDKTPQFDAHMNNGMGPLAALVATHDKALADKMMGPGINKAERALIVNKLLKGMEPEQIGVISDTLDMYDENFKKLLSGRGGGGGGGGGGGRVIVQPNREKIREGFLELYRSWFQQDPGDGELEGLIDQVANEFVSAQHQNRESDVQSTALQAVRSTDLYSQLYAKKPSGQTEDQFIGQFQTAGKNLLGGQLPSQQAVQQGMKTGSANATTQAVAQDKKTWENSAWLERVYQMAELANRLT